MRNVFSNYGSRTRPAQCLGWLAVCCLAFCAAGVVRAQDNAFVLDDSTFDQWMNNGLGGGVQNPNDYLTAQLESELASIERNCKLTEVQRERLMLAGQGDVARFMDRVNALRDEVVGKSYDNNDISNIYMRIQPLATELRQGVFQEDSLLRKLERSTLTKEQAEEVAAAKRERMAFQYAAKVRLQVVTLERAVPMTDEQRQAFVKLVLAETKPPLRFGEMDAYVTLYQISSLSEEKIAAIFDKAQTTKIQEHLQQARGLGAHLRQQGLIAEE
jgi:hypothetical protein